MQAVTVEKGLISSQEIAKRHNISYQTVNYYTNLGLLTVYKRRGNERLYDELQISQSLQRIAQLKNQGYSLRLIRKLGENETLQTVEVK